jgi:hypothetical protein
MSRGAVVTLEQAWELAKLWYEDRLDPGWRRRTPVEATAAFALIGLSGDFWKVV